MDRITKSMLDAFVVSEGLQTLTESEAFERFANFSVITPETSMTVDVEEVSCGSGNDTGLDGIAMIVNGSLVTAVEEVEALIETNGYLEVHFIFVQAKTTSGFSASDLGTFLFGVQDFFAEAPRLPRNEFVEAAATLQRFIIENGARMTRERPRLSLFYVSTGQWRNDTNLVARIESGKADLASLNLFGEVECLALGAAEIQNKYIQTQARVSAEFTFSNKVLLPTIEGVSEAYIGTLPASEFLSLIREPGGEIRKSVFYDNVRDFQDYNTVNAEIKATLESDSKGRFAILNNGVTLVAKTLRAMGNRFHVEDYQIVNGCQTSHVLYDNSEHLDDTVQIPLKVIVSQDESVTNSVIKATNRQTEVKPQQLYALSDFQKQLEVFYSSYAGAQKLYYERRSRQYVGRAGIEKVRVVSIQQQLRTFASMFLDQPHKGFYATALDALVGTQIFAEGHKLEPYYVSAFAYFRLGYFFRTRALDSLFNPARYDILMVTRHLFGGTWSQPSTNQMSRRSNEFADVLYDDASALALFERATEFIRHVAGTRALDRSLTKTQVFTGELIAALQAISP